MIRKNLRDYLTKALIKMDKGFHNPSLFFYIVDMSLKILAVESKGEFYLLHNTFIVSSFPNAIYLSVFSQGQEFIFKYIYSSSLYHHEIILKTLNEWKFNIKKFDSEKIFYLLEE